MWVSRLRRKKLPTENKQFKLALSLRIAWFIYHSPYAATKFTNAYYKSGHLRQFVKVTVKQSGCYLSFPRILSFFPTFGCIPISHCRACYKDTVHMEQSTKFVPILYK